MLCSNKRILQELLFGQKSLSAPVPCRFRSTKKPSKPLANNGSHTQPKDTPSKDQRNPVEPIKNADKESVEPSNIPEPENVSSLEKALNVV